MRIGIKSVSMDDIARELSISKKTIYKHFKDKKDLVSTVLSVDLNQEQNACIECYHSTGNSVQKMINISRYISHSHKDLNPTVLYDLQKYYPEEWSKMEKFRLGYIKDAIQQNITEGMEEGLYREDIKTDITATMYITLVRGTMEQLLESDNHYDFVTLHLQMVSYHLYGICTEDGRIYLQQHINEITNEQ